ncbi:MAG TPA: hypothetical protein VLM40_13695 [Gemmata sp.]|nr:hypothetical protein [Gemmata sp.]
MKTPLRTVILAVILLLVFTSPAAASESGNVSLFGSYWSSFVEYWERSIMRQNGIVMLVLGLGAVALFIITRGKWRD